MYRSSFTAPHSSVITDASCALETEAVASVIGRHKLVTALIGLGCSVAALLLEQQRDAKHPICTGGI